MSSQRSFMAKKRKSYWSISEIGAIRQLLGDTCIAFDQTNTFYGGFGIFEDVSSLPSSLSGGNKMMPQDIMRNSLGNASWQSSGSKRLNNPAETHRNTHTHQIYTKPQDSFLKPVYLYTRLFDRRLIGPEIIQYVYRYVHVYTHTHSDMVHSHI